MKKVIFYLQEIFNCPCYVYHEICHWVFIVPFWVVGYCSFPVIKINRLPSITINKDENTSQSISSLYMCVNYRNHFGISWINRVCRLMPALGLMILLYISPIYLYLYYFANINTLWMSADDIEKFINP